MSWTLHWLEAEGDLAPWHEKISVQICEAEAAVASIVGPQAIDVLIAYRHSGPVIPELGLCGFAYSPSMFMIACNPANPNFDNSVSDGAFKRQVVHEVHHCLRYAGPGYGRTLGEAIVSEGLAGRFVEHVLGTPPELWEKAVDPALIMEHLPDRDTVWSTTYDHSEWFFGTKTLPRWLGYTMGYEVVGKWIRNVGHLDAMVWINTPADSILAAVEVVPRCQDDRPKQT
ncbi:DUF2268 domain-containing putative Zn-dependent protease [Pseudosulfitobacter sp. SM2401]|uniref:DUF2268 domain-containing putative Zn-dependent protease n=1 Tax=Pseudosulfitobacter sp. SM2401 TaxID=3350098 RepID=UPI0036F2C80D